MNSNKIVITAAVTGSFGDRSVSSLPITPEEIANSALEAYEAGASVAHIHVRDVDTGRPSMAFELYEEVVQRIRDRSDMILNLTTGAGARFAPDDQEPVGFAPESTLCSPQKRIDHVVRLKPEICSLDLGSVNFGSHVFVNCLPHVEQMAEQIQKAGVKPEMEIFDLGDIEIANHLLKTGIVQGPPLFQLCLGIKWGAPATPQNMISMKQSLPQDAIWGAFSIGAASFPMMTQSALLGGNVRVGLEDNLYMEKNRRASGNKPLVEKAVTILRLLEKEPATPDEVRERLQLN
ncbi:3-keto-5-aminohexanoate cleavage protein [Desulfonema magnum]|uniref:3-keto-5-aminohexanoate cleavage protein domain-containing protein n=1 Tax=Desulfonema magnum TaxID=45655 RepID=A0A975GTA8_9BACT|nr:3-keto-5-aminohexanoate cleavage protein [Desulfonema magnum]QTA92925.1 3-keto-5-aminohexanoate cleavage protein domain-containing protein [Desulfonema magnum]